MEKGCRGLGWELAIDKLLLGSTTCQPLNEINNPVVLQASTSNIVCAFQFRQQISAENITGYSS
jgi:hypothetical protein